MSSPLRSVHWDDGKLIILDQTKLPEEVTYQSCNNYRVIIEAIRKLAVRGAPAIGVAAAYAVVLAAIEASHLDDEERIYQFLQQASQEIKDARPTAVNLSWAVTEMNKIISKKKTDSLITDLLLRAKKIEEQDQKICNQIADNGAALFKEQGKLNLLTHCNSGALATAGIGTAFGVIRRLHEKGQLECLYMDETRPLLQGARLTATEAVSLGMNCRLITDNMAAIVMSMKHIDAVIVGADRIAANGDSANKIGTYGLAILANYHHIPFYFAAPFSTFDFSISNGKGIPIETRNEEEVKEFHHVRTAPAQVKALNPAFDITPHELITGIITEKGVLKPPYIENIKRYERSLNI